MRVKLNCKVWKHPLEVVISGIGNAIKLKAELKMKLKLLQYLTSVKLCLTSDTMHSND